VTGMVKRAEAEAEEHIRKLAAIWKRKRQQTSAGKKGEKKEESRKEVPSKAFRKLTFSTAG